MNWALGPWLLGPALAAVGAVGFASAATAAAQTYTVSNLTDSGVENDGSLRGEVKAANTKVLVRESKAVGGETQTSYRLLKLLG
jgi:hypothetical protein